MSRKRSCRWAQIRTSKEANTALLKLRDQIEERVGLRPTMAELTSMVILDGVKVTLARPAFKDATSTDGSLPIATIDRAAE